MSCSGWGTDMINRIELFQTKEEAEAEGQRSKALLGPGYGYTFTVWQSGDVWMLQSSRYSSCD
jgi:hypothetical protein